MSCNDNHLMKKLKHICTIFLFFLFQFIWLIWRENKKGNQRSQTDSLAIQTYSYSHEEDEKLFDDYEMMMMAWYEGGKSVPPLPKWHVLCETEWYAMKLKDWEIVRFIVLFHFFFVHFLFFFQSTQTCLKKMFSIVFVVVFHIQFVIKFHL